MRASCRKTVFHPLRVVFVAGLSLWLGVGCLSVGREFPTSPVQRIVVGETSRAQINGWFGEPWRTGVDSGRRTWTYGHYRYSLFSPAQTRDLVVRFDAQGRVASYVFNSTYAEDRQP